MTTAATTTARRTAMAAAAADEVVVTDTVSGRVTTYGYGTADLAALEAARWILTALRMAGRRVDGAFMVSHAGVTTMVFSNWSSSLDVVREDATGTLRHLSRSEVMTATAAAA